MTRSSERELGDKWADKLRARGCWVQKLPSSSMAGLADWLVGCPRRGIRFVEAKRRHGKRIAYNPSQPTMAQWFFLNQIDRFGGNAGVVVLDEDGYLELDHDCAKLPMTGQLYDRAKEPYE